MRILISLSQFLLGGSETYSVTVAEQLERLGHPTRLFAGRASDEGRELAASRGLELAVGDPVALGELDEVDVVIAQDAASAYAAAGRGVPVLFVVHGLAAFEHPPGALRPPPRVIALNDRIARRAAALGGSPEVVRLRQPIDIERFRPRGASRPEARRVLVFSNYLEDDRLAILRQACDDLGLELVQLGVLGEADLDPREAIADADVVVGYGRSVLEAMGMGRAAYVWDRGGGDGWVTPESYPALEADGFSGAATGAAIDAERIRSDFAAYRPEMGTLAFDLVRQHHSVAKHAEALVPLLEGAEAPPGDGRLETLALLVRAEARAANRAGQFESQLAERAREAEELRAALAAEHEARLAAERGLEAVVRSSSWRLTAPLRRLGSRLRRRS